MGYYELSWAKKLGQKGLKAAHLLTQFACKDSWEKREQCVCLTQKRLSC